MPKIFVTAEGREHEIDARVGASLMESIVAGNLPLEAICGGCLSCATCHVYVAGDDFDKFPPREADEEDMLDLADGVTAYSRLSCQLKVTEGHEGVRVTLADS